MSVISAWQMQLLQNTGYIILNVLAFIFLWFLLTEPRTALIFPARAPFFSCGLDN